VSELPDYVLAAVRKHIEARRRDIAAKFPRNLPRREYWKLVGRSEELEAVAAEVQAAVRRANDAGRSDDEAT
jgi:hypothetical protein